MLSCRKKMGIYSDVDSNIFSTLHLAVLYPPFPCHPIIKVLFLILSVMVS